MSSRLLHEGFSARAQARPEATALAFKDETLSYGVLESASNRLAQLLVAAGCRPRDRVALLMPKSPAAIIAMLGALKAGAIYVPMDPDSPAVRLGRVLELADCRCVLAAGPVGSRLQEALALANCAQRPLVGWMDELPAFADFTLRDLAAQPSGAPALARAAGDAALILFTSGSTGQPKGVTLTHANVAAFLDWAIAYFGIREDDRVSQHAPLRFDISTFDIYGALWSGAEVHLVPPELNLLPHKLAQFIRESRLTQWFSVPAVLNLLAKFEVVAQGDFPDLRRVLFAGEVLPTPTLAHWMRRLPHARFTNLYGPTETTISSSYYTLPGCPADERAPIPIGRACAGEELLVLDDKLQPVAAGETGELCIAGAGLSPGYWRDARRTGEAFVPGPGGERIYRTGDLARRDAQGLVYFQGRADTQIKSRGYRIELGEIEAALHSVRWLRESAVVAVRSEGFEGWLICCAYACAQQDGALSTESLRRSLAALLPGYMLPARWLRCEALPKNESGKIDRVALRAAFQGAEARVGQAA